MTPSKVDTKLDPSAHHRSAADSRLRGGIYELGDIRGDICLEETLSRVQHNVWILRSIPIQFHGQCQLANQTSRFSMNP